MKSRLIFTPVMLTLVACAAMVFGAQAAVPVHTWTGGGDGTTWLSDDNWSGGAPNATTEQAKFTGECGSVTSAEDVSLAQLILDAKASLTLGFGGAALNVSPSLSSLKSENPSETVKLGNGASLTLDNVHATFTTKGQTYNKALGLGSGAILTLDNGSVVDNSAGPYGDGGTIIVKGGSTWNNTQRITGGTFQNSLLKATGAGSKFSITTGMLGANMRYESENGGLFEFPDGSFSGQNRVVMYSSGEGSKTKASITKNSNAGPNANGSQLIAVDSGYVEVNPQTYAAKQGGFVSGLDNNGVLIAATNGTVNFGANGAVATYFGTGTSDPETLLGNPTLRMVGDHPSITSTANLTIGSKTATVTQYPVIEFILGENGFSAAPLTSAGALYIVGNAKMIVDASAVTPPADGVTVEYPLAQGTKGLDTDAAMREAIEIVAKPPMTTAEVVVDEEAGVIVLKLVGTSEKEVVTPPAIASKVYTGETLVADVTGTDLYEVTKNDGGVEADAYDVVLTLTEPQYYTWPDSSAAALTIPFEITQAANEWTKDPSLSKSGWASGDDPATVDPGAAKFGEVVVTYDEGETEMPTGVGEHTAHFTVAETASWKGLSTNIAFTIRQGGYVYNEWLVRPSLSTNLWVEDEAAAEVNPGEPAAGEVVVTYDDGETEMPVNPGVHTAYFTVEETVDHSGLAEEIPYRVMARNAWVTAPSLDKDEWYHDEDPATVDPGEAKFGEVVVTYDEGETEMPTGVGAHTAHFAVAETDEYTALSSNIAYTVVRHVGPGQEDVEPVTYTWTNELRNALWHDFNWASSLAADKCCGYPNSKDFASVVFDDKAGESPLTVTFGADAAAKAFTTGIEAPALTIDLDGHTFSCNKTGEGYGAGVGWQRWLINHKSAKGPLTFKNGALVSLDAQSELLLNANTHLVFDGIDFSTSVPNTIAAFYQHGNTEFEVLNGSTIGNSGKYANIYGGSNFSMVIDNSTVYAYPRFNRSGGLGSTLVVRNGGLLSANSASWSYNGSNVTLRVEGQGSRARFEQSAYASNQFAGQEWTLAAVDGGSISMGIRAKTFAPLANASSYDIKTCLAVSNGTFAVTVSAFNFGIHQTDADCVSPTISLAGTNPVFSTANAFTFGSDAELANPPVLELMPAPGGFTEPAIRTGGEAYAVTIGSNVKVCVKLADLIAQNESKVKVDIARVPAGGTLNVDVAQLKANTEFVGAKTWTADYKVVDVVEDGGAAYKVLRGTFRSQGLLLFVR